MRTSTRTPHSTSIDRRSFLGGMASVPLIAMLSGCNMGVGTTETSGNRLSLLTYDDVNEAARMREQLSVFHDETGIEPILNTVPGSGAAEFPDKLRTRILGGQSPDVWRIWGGQIGQPFVEADLTTPLEDLYESYGWDELLSTQGIEGMTFHGEKHGVPMRLASLGAWCNLKVFEEAGAKEPTTYAELEEANDLIVESGVAPAGMGGKYGWHLMRVFEYLLEVTAGPDLHDQLLLGEETWEHSAVIDAFELFRKWNDRGWITPGALGISPDEAEQSIVQGSSAYTISGQWIENRYILESEQPQSDFGTFLLPTDHDEVRHSGFIEGFMISSASGNVDNAAELIDFMIQPETQIALANTQSATVEASPDSEEFPLSAQWEEIRKDSSIYTIQDQAFPQAVSDSYFAIQSSVLQSNISSQEAAQEMQSIVSEWRSSQ